MNIGKKKLIFLPYISLTLNILSFIFPTAFKIDPELEIHWIFGLVFRSSTGLKIFGNIDILIWFMLSATIIGLSTFSLIQNIRSIRKGIKDISIFWFAWILIGGFIIIVSLMYWNIFPYSWKIYTLNGSLVILYISGSLSILLGILIKILNHYQLI
jgi:hypothetical protein